MAQAGIEVSVYEAAGELKEIGAGVALHANAMRVLRFIGVEGAVRKIAGKTDYSVTKDGITGRVISQTSRARHVELQGIEPATVHRADLLDVLAAALPEGTASLAKRCVSVESTGSSAVASAMPPCASKIASMYFQNAALSVCAAQSAYSAALSAHGCMLAGNGYC